MASKEFSNVPLDVIFLALSSGQTLHLVLSAQLIRPPLTGSVKKNFKDNYAWSSDSTMNMNSTSAFECSINRTPRFPLVSHHLPPLGLFYNFVFYFIHF